MREATCRRHTEHVCDAAYGPHCQVSLALAPTATTGPLASPNLPFSGYLESIICRHKPISHGDDTALSTLRQCSGTLSAGLYGGLQEWCREGFPTSEYSCPRSHSCQRSPRTTLPVSSTSGCSLEGIPSESNLQLFLTGL